MRTPPWRPQVARQRSTVLDHGAVGPEGQVPLAAVADDGDLVPRLDSHLHEAVAAEERERDDSGIRISIESTSDR
jgi:hypothetical protein